MSGLGRNAQAQSLSLWSAGLLELGCCSVGLKRPLGQGKMKVQLLLAWGHKSQMS